MSLHNLLVSALLKMRQRSNQQLTPEHRLRRNRNFLAQDRSKVPATVRVRAAQIGGLNVEWISPQALADNTDGPVCLYLHGGAFVMGGPNSHRDMAASLALKAGLTVLVLDYRLAPQHPFPAALDDVLAVYRALLAQGIPQQRLCIGGDSAGGNLALATVQAIRDAGLGAPRAFFLFSPWLDLNNNSASCQTNRHSDVMLNTQLLDEAAALYLGEVSRDDVRASPLRGSVAQLPPCLVIASAREILRDDALRLRQNLEQQGGHIEYLEWEATPHAFPVLARYLPEGRAALDATAAFLRRHLTAAP